MDTKKELQEHHYASFEPDKAKKRKLTKFDILMLNPKSLPRRPFVREELRHKEIAENQHEEVDEFEGDEEQMYRGNGLLPSEEKEYEPVNYNKLVEDLFLPGNGLKLEKIQNADYENDIVKEHILKLRTGEDAIKFFAKYGNSTPIKFLNCYQDQENSKRPYDLLIQHDIQQIANYPQYYTVSPTGIVRVYNNLANQRRRNMGLPVEVGDDTTEYISLSDWMKESTQFNIVSNIHYFKNFSAIKLFTFWRSNVKYKKFIKLRQSLVKNVFFCKPVFVDKVMSVNRVLQDVQSYDMVTFSVYLNKPAYSDIFMNDQKQIKEKALTAFGNIYESIIATLEDTLKKLKENKNEKLTSELERINFGKQIKQKAIYLQKLEKKIKKLRDDLAREDFSKYRGFVRLVNYMAVENLITATNTCLLRIRDEISKHQKHSGGLFLTIAGFQHNAKGEMTVNLHHVDTDVITNFQKILDEIIEGLRDVHKTLTSAQAEHFKSDEPGSEELKGLNIQKTIHDSVVYNEVKKFLDDKIKSDYNDAFTSVSATFLLCAEIEEFRSKEKGFDPLAWKEKNHELKEIEDRIIKWKLFKQTLNKEIQDKGYGIFAVDAKQLKKNLHDYIEECMTAFLEKLKEFYIVNSDRLYKELKETCENLEKKFPEDPIVVKEKVKLKDYTLFITQQENAAGREKGIDEEKKQVEKAYALLTQNKIKLDPHNASLKAKIEGDQSRYLGLVKAALEEIERIKPTMLEKLEEAKNKSKDHVDETLGKLQEKELIELPTDPEKRSNLEQEITNAIIVLDHINESIENIKKENSKLEGYSGKMAKKDLKKDDKNNFKLLEDRFNERNRLWRNLKSFEENKKNWMHGEFLRLDPDDVEKSFKQYESDKDSAATKLFLLTGSKSSTSDPILTEFNNRLAWMRNWIPIIVSLGNKNLHETHWRQIFDKLRDPIKYKTKKDFSMQDLIEDDVLSIKDFIEEISARASGEAKIENDLNDIRKNLGRDNIRSDSLQRFEGQVSY
jgi:dynein heavy chain